MHLWLPFCTKFINHAKSRTWEYLLGLNIFLLQLVNKHNNSLQWSTATTHNTSLQWSAATTHNTSLQWSTATTYNTFLQWSMATIHNISLHGLWPQLTQLYKDNFCQSLTSVQLNHRTARPQKKIPTQWLEVCCCWREKKVMIKCPDSTLQRS